MIQNPMRGRRLAAALALSALFALPACSAEEEAAGEAAASDETLAGLVADADDLSAVADALGEAGLAQVFDSVAAYTLLAPNDAAFDALGEAGEQLRAPEQRAAMVAILRDHIVPGYLTPEDIGKAIELSDERSVTMTTMGDHILTFTAGEGDTILVTGPEGATATIAGEALRARNGVAIPVDGVLKTIEPPAA